MYSCIKRVFPLVVASSHMESHVVVLIVLYVSPGCCSPVLGPLRQGIDVQLSLACKDSQRFVCGAAATAGGYGWEQEQGQAGSECHLSGP